MVVQNVLHELQPFRFAAGQSRRRFEDRGQCAGFVVIGDIRAKVLRQLDERAVGRRKDGEVGAGVGDDLVEPCGRQRFAQQVEVFRVSVEAVVAGQRDHGFGDRWQGWRRGEVDLADRDQRQVAQRNGRPAKRDDAVLEREGQAADFKLDIRAGERVVVHHRLPGIACAKYTLYERRDDIRRQSVKYCVENLHTFSGRAALRRCERRREAASEDVAEN